MQWPVHDASFKSDLQKQELRDRERYSQWEKKRGNTEGNHRNSMEFQWNSKENGRFPFLSPIDCRDSKFPKGKDGEDESEIRPVKAGVEIRWSHKLSIGLMGSARLLNISTVEFEAYLMVSYWLRCPKKVLIKRLL